MGKLEKICCDFTNTFFDDLIKDSNEMIGTSMYFIIFYTICILCIKLYIPCCKYISKDVVLH